MIASTITAIVATVFKPFCRFVAKLSPNVKKFVQPSLSAAKAFTEQNAARIAVVIAAEMFLVFFSACFTLLII